MRRSFVLLALGTLAFGALSGGIGWRSTSGADFAGARTDLTGAVDQAALPSGFFPTVTLTVEPADGAVFGLPAAVPVGTNLLLFNVGDRTYDMVVFEKNPSQTASWDTLLACGLTSDVATVVSTVRARAGEQSKKRITIQNEGQDLLALIPTGPSPSESPAATEAPAPSGAPSALPSEAASPIASEAASPSAAPVESAAPSESPAVTCETPSPAASASQAPVSKPTASSGPSGAFPDLSDALVQEFLVTPAGTPPGETPPAAESSATPDASGRPVAAP